MAGLVSCSENSESKTSSTNADISLEWEILDSLDFGYLGDPLLADINEEAGKAIFYNYVDQMIIISDLEGNVINEFKKTEDTPDSYGFLMQLPGFYDDNSIQLLGMAGAFIYDLEGNLVKKIDHPEPISMAALLSQVGKTNRTTSFGGKDYIISQTVRSHDSYPGEMEFYEKFHALELIDVEGEKSTEILPFPEGSIFLNGMGYNPSDYTPAFRAKGNKLYAALGGEPILHVMTLSENGASMDSLIQLEIPDFMEIEGKELSSFSEGSITVTGNTAAIRDIHLVDGKILVSYYCGMAPEKMEEIMAMFQNGSSQEEVEEVYNRYEKDVKSGVLVFEEASLAYLGMLDMTDQLPNASFASAGDYLWMQRPASKEVEEEFRRIYKVGVVIE